ncbi:MAG: polysaccharide biosynthesis C-terminal domain-containing protein [Candidatus Marinimicrobia bacterium]|nr:polysaccharide biosynthesis C-terminal domain-containing protein [Candidatus Neomarinimicrobiota bacterium]
MAKHSSIYLIGNISSKLIGLVLLPLYTSRITLSDYGFYALFDVSIQFCQGFLHLGIPNALFRWMNLEQKETEKKAIFFSSYLFTVLFLLIICLPLFFLSTSLARGILGEASMNIYFQLSTLIIFFSILNMIPLFTLRVREKSLYYVVAVLAKFVVQLLVTILAIVQYDKGILGIFLGLVVSEVLMFVMLLPFVIRQTVLRVLPKELKEMIRFGFPLSLSGLASRVLNIGDRYVLGYLTTLEVVGAYDIGYRIANAVDVILIHSFQNSFQQLVWKNVKAPNIRRLVRKLLDYFLFVFLWIILAVSVFSYDLVNLLTVTYEEYLAAAVIIPTILLSIVFRGAGFIFNQTLQMANKTAPIAYIMTGTAILNIGLNFLFIPFWGMQGAALATLFSFIIYSGISAYLSEKYFQITYTWSNIGKLFVTTVFLYGAITLLPPLPPVPLIIIKIVFIALFPFLLYVFRFYELRELTTLKNLLSKKSLKK